MTTSSTIETCQSSIWLSSYPAACLRLCAVVYTLQGTYKRSIELDQISLTEPGIRDVL
jgi:hypothetical protein